jgi:hypothetical protein
MIVREAAGVGQGYGLFPVGFARAATLVAHSPGDVLVPALGRTGVRLATIAFLLLVVCEVRRSVAQRVLLMTLVAVSAPVFLFAVPQGRYYYLAAPFVFAIVSIGVARRFGRVVWALAVGGLVVIQGILFRSQSVDWRNAYAEATSVAEALRSRIESSQHSGPIVVVNLPDRYGDPRDRWRPYAWRNGTHRIWPGLRRIYTREHAMLFAPHNPPIYERSEVRNAFPHALLLEVRAEEGETRWEYRVSEFRESEAR